MRYCFVLVSFGCQNETFVEFTMVRTITDKNFKNKTKTDGCDFKTDFLKKMLGRE